MIFRLLGQVEAVYDDRSLPLGAPKQRCVLAALLLEPRQLVSLNRLYDAVWGTHPPAAARKATQVYISNLRRVLEPIPDVAITSFPDGYRLDVDPDQIDLHRFRRLVAEAATSNADDARTLLHAAIGLWRGPVLSGLGECDLRDQHADALHEECLSAYERRVAADLDAGQAAELVPQLLWHAGENPFRETVHALLMTALQRAGRRAEALGVFRDLRARMIDELGSEPGAEVFSLHQELLEAEHADEQGGGAPERAASTDESPMVRPTPAQLPPAVADFHGRETVAARIRAAVTGQMRTLPVVTLTGQGGAGKTALALRVAHQVRELFTDGQLFANMRGSSDAPAEPADVLAAFLRALGTGADEIPAGVDDRSALYRTLLAGRRVLVVLDDAADAAQVRPLLPGDEQCAVLVIARSRLFLLEGSLSVEIGEFTGEEAHQLLASTVGADRVAAEPDAAEAIVRACGHLPLALRIAGSRLAAQPGRRLADFAERLGSARVLDELTVADVGVRSSLALSYQQLDPATARAFRLLALPEVASLSWRTAAAVLDVGDAELQRITNALVDLHLLTEPAPGRYRYHDLLRVYARERSYGGAPDSSGEHGGSADGGGSGGPNSPPDPAAERDQAVRRGFEQLAGSAAHAVQAMMPALDTPPLQLEGSAVAQRFGDRATAVEWLADEHVNLTTISLQVLGQPDPPLYGLAQLASLLGNYAEAGGYWSGWEALAAALLERARHEHDKPSEMLVRMCLGGYALRQGPATTAIEHLGMFVDHHRRGEEHTTLGRGLTMLALAHLEVGAVDEALRCFDEALYAHERGGNRRSYAITSCHLAELFVKNGEYEQAVARASAAIEVWRELGSADPYLGVDASKNLGLAYAALGRYTQAIQHGETSLRLGDAAGYTLAHRVVAATLARAHRDAGNLPQAASFFERALGEAHDPREPITSAVADETLRHELGQVLTRMGRVEHARASRGEHPAPRPGCSTAAPRG
ncbi:hypothetical protein EF847_11790 [Actinobacteria bacterium YIM 96077]|uniref:OmpR/PhoB-type domain-containing protein n=1 Tax=Phytoactinopolyspora halophila TaxID=1981511 RepID=A0A329QZ38_9ACTN|nr:BTAD domain-containing putative transcriptional regulator [Phytoactinopolyspora halophila]AYY13277.1 hypothetical protein EF847_11790 [Actinobacteria bacterium YIM 96077]RAW17487.1 hypothetical protein DPM12_05630 [Phytoactinopolyspora halophila]